MTVLSLNKPTSLNLSPNFSANDRLIDEQKYQKQYVSAIFAPKEVTINIEANSIDLRFTYDIPDMSFKQVKENAVFLHIGLQTQRIFRIEATFGGKNFKVLIRRLQNIIDCIKEFKRKNNSKDVDKSYELILKTLDTVSKIVNKDREEIEVNLFS
jgi:hypothetical protein